jgi:fructose-specific phosphotransferase system IIA component
LKEELINLNLKGKNKKEIIEELAELMKKRKEITNHELFLRGVFEREELGSTGIGEGIALPHARSNGVSQLIIVFGRSIEGVDFDSLDGEPVNLIFLIGTPKEDIGNYLKALAHLSRILKKESFRKKLLSVSKPEEVILAFKEVEE